MGDHDAPALGGGQIDRFIARAHGADDLELRQQGHLGATQPAAAVGQHGPDGLGGLANGVCPVGIVLPLVDGVPGRGQRGHAFRSDSHQSQDTDSHERSFATNTDQAHFSTGLAPRHERAPRPMEALDGEERRGDALRGQDAVSPGCPGSVPLRLPVIRPCQLNDNP